VESPGLSERSRKRKDYFTGCLPWPQKGTASFIADTGNLAVATTSVPNYPFGHAFHFETDTGQYHHERHAQAYAGQQ
jgi:hypothetical protein